MLIGQQHHGQKGAPQPQHLGRRRRLVYLKVQAGDEGNIPLPHFHDDATERTARALGESIRPHRYVHKSGS